MKILLHSASQLEVAPLLEEFKTLEDVSFQYNGHEIHVLVSGVGMMATAYHLGKLLATEDFDLALNLGICGSLDRNIDLGQSLLIASDLAIEEGAEAGEKWLSLEDMGLRKPDEFPYQEGLLLADLAEKLAFELKIPIKRAVSVNRVLGSEASINKLKQHSTADVVSMEGAAFYYACQNRGLPAVQIRTVSNYVEKRDRAAWKVEEAIANLAQTTLNVLNHV